jgi:hypothetical protein
MGPVYIDILTAVERLAADISDQEVIDQDEADEAVWNPAAPAYRKRERVIMLLRDALRRAELPAWVLLPSGELIQLTGIDWKTAKLWRDIILGGVVRAFPPEEMDRYEGGRVLLEDPIFETWRLRRLPADVKEVPAAGPAVDMPGPEIVAEPAAEPPTANRPDGISDLVWAVIQTLDAMEHEHGAVGLAGIRRGRLLDDVRRRLPDRPTLSPRTLDTAIAERRKRAETK